MFSFEFLNLVFREFYFKSKEREKNNHSEKENFVNGF